MSHRHIPFVIIVLAAIFSVAADKKPETAKEPAPTAAQIQQWVKQLGDESFKVREEATRDLIKARGVAFDTVTKAIKSKDPEVKQRALRIIKHHEEVAKQLEKAAIAYFKKLGGRVKVVDKSPGIGLDLLETKVTDAGLVHLKGLTKRQELYLGGTKVTDAGLVHLQGLKKLQKLELGTTFFTEYYTKITNDGLVHLKGLAKLQKLYLKYTKVTKAGIDKLQKALPNCSISWDGN